MFRFCGIPRHHIYATGVAECTGELCSVDFDTHRWTEVEVEGRVSGSKVNMNTGGVHIVGTVQVDGKGYAGGMGPGRAPAAKSRYCSAQVTGGGGGHGGIGGRSNGQICTDCNGAIDEYPRGGATYGHTRFPVELGSGGGRGYDGKSLTGEGGQGGHGGGAIKLFAERHIHVDSTTAVTAQGAIGGYYANAHGGSGAGGSIWLQAARVYGSIGVIDASGGLSRL